MRHLFALLSSTELATIILAASQYLTTARAFSFQRVPAANLDISQLGHVGVVGDFDGVSLYQFAGQTQNPGNTNGSMSLLSRYPTGAFATLQSSDASIQAMCPFVLKDGTLAGVVVGGNFTSLGGVQANGIALFNATTSQIIPLPGLSGRVSALYCDSNSSTVYVGGSFTGANSSNAIAWTTGWTNLPFQGFDGPVSSITKTNSGNIIFGGKFTGLGNSSTVPTVRDIQVIPIGSGNITSVASSTANGFSDPRNIICKNAQQDGPGNTWELQDNTPGSWSATFQFGFVPSKLRLYNTNQDGRGTKTWRYTALPLNGIMNFSYIDPDGQKQYCDARCPLPQNNKTEQDFTFVNQVGMNAFRVDISDWYGSGAGLAGIELFQNDIYSFAINEFNEQACGGVTTGSASSTRTGPWAVTPSQQSSSEYLTANLTGDITSGSASVTFVPNIKQSGNYSITLYTPGCIQDNTCSTRGRVNVTGVMSTDGNGGSNKPFSVELYQTNYYDKYDEIYNGRVDTTNGGFKPSITLSPSSGQSGPLTVVAQRVRADLKSNNTGGLNGVYEYNPNLATAETDFTKSAINVAGNELNTGATVNAVVADGNTVYVAGSFSNSKTSVSSILSVSDGAKDLGEGGLNGPVQAMYLNSSVLYMGGSFNATTKGTTQGLKGVAAYNISTSKWSALGAGINGVATYMVPFAINLTASNKPELAIAVSGTFDSVLAFGSNKSFSAANFAVWIPGRANWLQNLNMPHISLKGTLTASTLVPNNPPLLAGSVSSQDVGASGAVELSGTGTFLRQFPIGIQHTSSTADRKRAVAGATTNGVVTGLFYHDNSLNLTIYGGHFTSAASNGSVINNLAIINNTNNGAITGLAGGVSSDSIIQTLGFQKTLLFTGGRISGSVHGRDVKGLIVYDLQASDYATPQPAALQGSSVVVNAIAPQPSTTLVYVGGTFDSAGSFSCPSLCVYDITRGQWNSPGNGLTGAVAAMIWVDNTHLVLVGNLSVNGNASAVVKYDSKASSFTALGGPSGSITTLTPASQDGTQFWVTGSNTDGTPLLQKYDGSTWTAIQPALGAGSTIQGLQVFTTTQSHATSSLLEKNNALLVLGQLDVPNFGNASGALFNGTTWTPYLLSVSGSGSGSMSQVFVEKPGNFFKNSGHHLAVGLVVLVALAIALAIIFILVIAGILSERYQRNKDGFQQLPQVPPKGNENMSRIPPEHLFGNIGPGGRGAGGI
ncbi:hypothetical protein EG327_000620 [Venturia inaequalis]|uniref:Cellular morphogenesis protein n=1 Tax=Venturia inaequalis TaxID=5025 RepID=A0A8H3VNP2_VENIN|nr:hypothetical protein EG327_000620 [Venturia inaequalis]